MVFLGDSATLYHVIETPLRHIGLGWFVAFALVLGACSRGQTINKDRDDVAILGYDAVAYFTEGRAVLGSPEYEHEWQEARGRFSSGAHRDLFAGNPEAYAPQYGGNCAGGMARGVVSPIDPEAWVIVDGKLYLNYDKRFAAEFIDDAPSQIAKADANWEERGRSE